MSKTEKTAVKNSLDARVRAIAESGKGKGMPNWFNLPQNKEKRTTHIEVCTKLAELSKKYGNYPITYLVYFAVGKNAHRIPTFLSGYTKIDETKAEKIFSWLKLFAKYHKNDKLFRNPNVAHALCRFYDKFSTKTKDFKAAMESMESNPKIDVKNAKAIVEGMGIAKQPKEQPKVDVTEMEAAMEAAEVEVAAAAE
jgi:hypothetical protein